jgi:endonuclease III
MARPADGIDLGLWHGVAPAQLVIPVDAHVLRIGRYLGLTSRRQADWKTALEITGALRRLDPDDPVKYDFALAHLGISEGCGKASSTPCLTCNVAELCSGDDGKPAPARRGRA